MPLLTQEKAIKEYFEQVKEKYPGIDFERFAEICKTPGNFIKECIRGEGFPRILVKHIGKFRVFKGKIKKQLENEEAFYKRGITTEEYYIDKKNKLTSYLNILTQEDEKANGSTNREETID